MLQTNLVDGPLHLASPLVVFDCLLQGSLAWFSSCHSRVRRLVPPAVKGSLLWYSYVIAYPWCLVIGCWFGVGQTAGI